LIHSAVSRVVRFPGTVWSGPFRPCHSPASTAGSTLLPPSGHGVKTSSWTFPPGLGPPSIVRGEGLFSVLRSHQTKGLAILLARPSDSRGWRYIRANLYSDGRPDDQRVSDDDLSDHQTRDAHPDEEHRKPRRESILLTVELHLAPTYTFILVHRAFALRCFKLLNGQNTVLAFTTTPVIYLGLQYLSLAVPMHLLFVVKTCLRSAGEGSRCEASCLEALSGAAYAQV